jgi:ribonuclease R
VKKAFLVYNRILRLFLVRDMTKKTREERLFSSLLKVTAQYIQGKGYNPQTKKELVSSLEILPEQRSLFDAVVKKLVESDKIHCRQKKYYEGTKPYRFFKGEKIVKGSISVHPRRFGFVNQADPEKDIFVPKPYLNGAVDGDIVEVLIDPYSFSRKGPEGKVVSIIERKRNQLVGVVTFVSKRSAEVYSLLLGEDQTVLCPLKKNHSIQRGDRVLLNVSSWGENRAPTTCSLSQVLGHISEPSGDVKFAVFENELRDEFPKDVIDEANKFGTKISSSELKTRSDLRHLECITIDPDTAKDFDDAISLEKKGKGYRLGVHIADVSHYVQKDSCLDREALLRCNSTYFPNECLPMLPRPLSESLCSLKPNVNRFAISVLIDLDATGEVECYDIQRSVIKSRKRLTYKQAKAILDGKSKTPFAPLLHRMVKVCNLLKQVRTDRGSLQLYVPELVIKVDPKGNPTGVETVEYDITHQMIEEFMLKANELIAIHLSKQGKDLSYRVHEAPAEESLENFSSLATTFGFSVSSFPTPQEIQQLFIDAEGSPYASHLAISYIKSMRLACYSADNIGHYGLGLEHYCHFTSPIRRYVDLIVHRLLFEKELNREALVAICNDASEKERVSSRAEASVRNLKKLRLLQQKKKENPKKSYEAIITRVKPYGICFDVIDLMLEGFLHVSELEDDYFEFDEEENQLDGIYTGKFYRCGEKICVICNFVDLIVQQAGWRLSRYRS